MTTPSPIERASVEQAREILASAVADVSARTAAHIRRGENEWPVGAAEALRAIQQAHAAGVAEGLEQAAKVADEAASSNARLEAECLASAEKDGSTAGRQADNERAVGFAKRKSGAQVIAALIRNLSPGENA